MPELPDLTVYVEAIARRFVGRPLERLRTLHVLEAMGALLSLAGRRSQVIVLTCFPDRYRHVVGATVVRMG